MAVLHGAETSLALGWLTDHDQQIRFKTLSGIADLNNKTVLDAGCGYADLFSFLSTDNTLAHYYGIEQIPELITEAERRHAHLRNVSLLPGNFMMAHLPEADYVFASGSLNYGSSDAGYIFKAITHLYEHCRLGLAFNLLRHVPRNGLIVAYDPELILSHCHSLSQNIVLKTDYADEDFTIWMYR